MRNILSMLVIVGLVMALPLGLLAWEAGEEENKTTGSSCPISFYGQMQQVYYYYVQDCSSCTMTWASAMRPHLINGMCLSCNPGAIKECTDPISMSFLSSVAGSADNANGGMRHSFDDADTPLEKYVPAKAETADAQTSANSFIPTSFQTTSNYDEDYVVRYKPDEKTKFFFRLLKVRVTSALGNHVFHIGQELDPEYDGPFDGVIVDDQIEEVGAYAYSVTFDDIQYEVRTVNDLPVPAPEGEEGEGP